MAKWLYRFKLRDRKKIVRDNALYGYQASAGFTAEAVVRCNLRVLNPLIDELILIKFTKCGLIFKVEMILQHGFKYALE